MAPIGASTEPVTKISNPTAKRIVSIYLAQQT